LEKLDGFENAGGYDRGVLLRIVCDVLSQVGEVPDGPSRPNSLHFGAFVSARFPHDFSHFETFSWLTTCPELSSAIPA